MWAVPRFGAINPGTLATVERLLCTVYAGQAFVKEAGLAQGGTVILHCHWLSLAVIP
jgi:hypothetical protein